MAAAQSPSGMVLVGKHGAGVLSVSALRGGSTEKDLGEFWKIAEQTAEEHGNTMDREEWRDVLHVHLAETRKDAIEQARVAAGRYQREYFENTLGLDSVIDGPPDKIIDSMVETGAWCVGTPDDLIETIERLDRDSGGFGGLLVQATEWGTREQVLHSYELIARYVMPRFQGSLVNLSRSQAWVAGKKDELEALRTKAIDRAQADYAERRLRGFFPTLTALVSRSHPAQQRWVNRAPAVRTPIGERDTSIQPEPAERLGGNKNGRGYRLREVPKHKHDFNSRRIVSAGHGS